MRAHEFVVEKWSNKYKKSINCSRPKGFSQKAHCAGRKKNEGVAEGLDSIPAALYHATYRELLKSIKKYGLGGDRAQAKWEDSKPGVVYLAVDPNVAESYAEANDVVPEEWLDEIVILKISTNGLDINNFDIDSNVQDNTGDTIQYIGIIPVSNISLVRQGVAEDLDENLRKWFKDKWVRFGPDGKIRGDCARGSSKEGKPKCLPKSKAQNLGKKGRAKAAARKRREDPNANRSGNAINVKTK